MIQGWCCDDITDTICFVYLNLLIQNLSLNNFKVVQILKTDLIPPNSLHYVVMLRLGSHKRHNDIITQRYNVILVYVGNINIEIKTKEKISCFLLSLCSCCYVVITSAYQDVHTANITICRSQLLCGYVQCHVIISRCSHCKQNYIASLIYRYVAFSELGEVFSSSFNLKSRFYMTRNHPTPTSSLPVTITAL